MTNEVSLSEHIVDDERSGANGYIHAQWVKEAVKKERKVLFSLLKSLEIDEDVVQSLIVQLDKIMGPKLI